MQYGLTTLNTADYSEMTEVNAVELLDAKGIKSTGAWVLPLDAWHEVVTGEALDAIALNGFAAISEEHPAIIDPHSVYGLVVGLSAEESGGAIGRIRVHYNTGLQDLYSDGGNEIVIPAVGETCFD